jgi:hypothetical protein
MIDLRKEFRDLISDHGHWMVLRQAIPGRRCACYNPKTKSISSTCNRCLGTGYAYVDRFVKGRKSRPIGITQALGAERVTAIGQMAPIDNIFYIQHNMRPTSVDYVLCIALDPVTNSPIVPYRVLSVHRISDVREQRDKGGRIEYYALTAETRAWPEFNINA